jgi:hypothetical protein
VIVEGMVVLSVVGFASGGCVPVLYCLHSWSGRFCVTVAREKVTCMVLFAWLNKYGMVMFGA